MLKTAPSVLTLGYKLATVLVLTLLFSCSTSKDSAVSHVKEPQDPDKFILSGHIVEKEFIKKNGQATGFTELYFRASVQDYFIKFCESQITRKDLEPFIDQVVTVQADIKDGNWDICEDDPAEMQSRVGAYMVVKKLM